MARVDADLTGQDLAMRHVALVLLTLALFGCGQQVITQREGLSTDSVYVHFVADSTPFVHEGEVGGEHRSYVKVLGFRDEQYFIELVEADEGVELSLSHDPSLSVEKKGDTMVVTIQEDDALLEIGLVAHPGGSYVVRVSRLP